MRRPNAQYNLARPAGLVERMGRRVRGKMYRDFIEGCGVKPNDTILDVGITSDQSYEASNYLEALHPDKAAITACGLDDPSSLRDKFPDVKFVVASGLHLPFANRSFDFVHSSAVLEHVGTLANQERLIFECARVARRGFFVTTPNPWFPVEFHTQLPLVHWLPKRRYRAVFKLVGLEFFAEEANLNLMNASELTRAGAAIGGYSVVLRHQTLFGWRSNLLLQGLRLPAPSSK
jgi:Methyltransferase domain